jgi:hypothetical protein
LAPYRASQEFGIVDKIRSEKGWMRFELIGCIGSHRLVTKQREGFPA